MKDFLRAKLQKFFESANFFRRKTISGRQAAIVCRPRVFFLDVSLVSLYSVYKAELYAVAVIVLQSAS